jgi:mono/diheme cytochrome c family protein
MGDSGRVMKYVVIGVLVLGGGLVAWRNFGPSDQPGGSAKIVVPQQLSPAATLGKAAFDDNCAQCHGVNAIGTDQGPPLIHDYYNPGHHADGAFYLAVANGVRQHHWRYGNMPPQPQVTQDQSRMIIAYVREVQVANGIGYKPH